MANRLTKKVGLYFIGNVSSRFLGAILIPVYAFSVSPAALGRYDYVLTVGQLVAPLAFVAIWEAALRFLIVDRSPEGVRSAVSTIVSFTLVVCVVGTLLGLAAAWTLPVDPVNVAGLTAVALLYGVVQVWQFVARAEQQTRLYMLSGITSAAVTLALVIALVVIARFEFTGLVVAYIVGQLSIIVLIEFRMGVVRRVSRAGFDWQLLGRMTRYSAPLVINLVSLGLLTGFGRILIYNVEGEAANGVYTFAMRFATIVVSLGTVVSMSVIEEGLLRAASSKVGDFYSRVLASLISAVFIFTIALVPVLYVFFLFISETEYFGARDLVPIMLLFAVFSVIGTNFGSVLMTVGRTGPLAVSTLVGAAVTVASSLLLIHALGLFGVALAMVVGALTTMVLRLVFSKRRLNYSVAGWRAVGLASAYVVVSCLCFFVAESADSWVVPMVAVAVCCACAWPLFKSLKAIKEIPDDIEA